MTIVKNLGGDRLGSGNKMNVAMHNYERSTHDLSRVWRSTMSCGTLVPFMTEITLPGDTWDIDLNTMIRTVPTLAPLFGSFKVQLDVFTVPIRLYNAMLHMNKLGVGLKMSEIKLPLMKIVAKGETTPDRFDQSCLLAYLGVRGAPQIFDVNGVQLQQASFRKNALFLLGYWDIYKNYYANKQEEKGYMIGNTSTILYEVTRVFLEPYTGDMPVNENGYFNPPENIVVPGTKIRVEFTGQAPAESFYLEITKDDLPMNLHLVDVGTYKYLNPNLIEFDITDIQGHIIIHRILPMTKETPQVGELEIVSFPLENIDDVQLQLLKADNSVPFELNEYSKLPYYGCLGNVVSYNFWAPNYYSQNGLGIKTFQSDIFNNWLNTEWIDGDNGINAISAINTSDGSFTIDTLNLSKKVYDMLNRVAVSGGSYEDWQSAIWGEEPFRRAESPIYCGGLSTELIFEEVVSTADATTTDGEVPLGSLAGRGTQSGNKKGGKVVIRTNEPSIIIGLVSITPRIDYSQGNKWHTRLNTMDDFHKPALDGIGFQELLTEQMAHWDAKYIRETQTWIYKSAGKQPAWLNYMTSYNETYGHFAENTGSDALMQLTLNRQYECDEITKSIKDLTTYIDPSKFNYAFATKDLTAQNFWVQIGVNAIARRKMSAKIIPNL